VKISIDPVRVEQALDTQPDLAIDGFRYTSHQGPFPETAAEFADRRAKFFDEDYRCQIATACAYYRLFGIDKGRGSYGLKHLVESWGHDKTGRTGYVTNGCAILAAVICGYALVRERNSPNCRFKKDLAPPLRLQDPTPGDRRRNKKGN
jgi:hypothetical protein